MNDYRHDPIPFHQNFFDREEWPDGSTASRIEPQALCRNGVTMFAPKTLKFTSDRERALAATMTAFGFHIERVYRYGCAKCGYAWDEEEELCRRCNIRYSHEEVGLANLRHRADGTPGIIP